MMGLDRIPHYTGGELYHRVERVQPKAWGPGRDARGPLTELHLEMEARGVDLPIRLIMRPHEVDRLIAAVRKVRFAAWPHIPEGEGS